MLIIDALFTVENGKVGYPSVSACSIVGDILPCPVVRLGMAWPGHVVTVYGVPPVGIWQLERAAQSAYDDFIKEQNNGGSDS